MEEQEKPQEEVKEEQEEVKQEEVVDDRPEKNYKAEIDRKNREIERLRALAERSNTQPKRDPTDISTWSDHELKAILSSNDPSVQAYKGQADDILFDRRVARVRERERTEEKRSKADLEVRTKYPDALDPTSEFSARMEQVMHDFELQKTPAGRLAAAKLVAAELQKGAVKGDAIGRKLETDRVRDVKAQMVDGDRPKPTEVENSPDKDKALLNKVRNEGIGHSAGFSELMTKSGLKERMFKKWDK